MNPDAQPTARRSIGAGVLAGAGAGAIAGLLDAGLAFARGPVRLELVVVAAGLLAVVGATGGLVLAITGLAVGRPWIAAFRAAPARGPDGRLEHALAVLVAAVALGVGLLGLARLRFAQAPLDRRLLALALFALGLFAIACPPALARALGRNRRAPMILAGAIALAGVLMLPWLARTTETIDVRPLLVAAFGLVAFVVLRALDRPRLPRRRVAFALVLVALAVVAPLRLAAQNPLRLLAARYAPLTGSAARLVARVVDFDGDGYSPLSGEGDCAPWDGNVHPFAVDVPGNGRDEDCRSGDLDPARVAARPIPELAPPEPRARPHVLFITVDTLRADRLGIYGYARDTTPNIDAFAADAVVFERVYSSSPVTDRSLPTLLGGLYPSMYTEALDYEHHELSARRVLLGERLRDAGYYTAAISTTAIIKRDNLQQGLRHVDLRAVAINDVRAEPLTNRALSYLDRAFAVQPRKDPLFLWLHYYDPHGPYLAPPSHRKWDDGKTFTEKNRSDRYDGEVSYVDGQIARVLDRLRELGELDDMLVVITSDHGEEFLEHGGWYHAEELYDESVRVPLIVRLPGGGGPRWIEETIGLVDVMPTLLELLDIAAPSGIEGRSQAAAVRGTGPVDTHPIFLEQWKHKTDRVQKIAVVDGTDKLVLDLENQLWELYDVRADPAEKHERYAEDPDTGHRLRDLLLDYWAEVSAARQLALPDGSF